MAVCLWARFLSEHLCDSCMNIVSCILLRVSPRSHNRPPFITAASALNTSSIKTHCLRTYVKIRYVLKYLEGNWIETLSLPTNGLMCDPPGSFRFRTIVTQKIELYCLHVECWAEGDKARGGGGGSLSECFLLHSDFLSEVRQDELSSRSTSVYRNTGLRVHDHVQKHIQRSLSSDVFDAVEMCFRGGAARRRQVPSRAQNHVSSLILIRPAIRRGHLEMEMIFSETKICQRILSGFFFFSLHNNLFPSWPPLDRAAR